MIARSFAIAALATSLIVMSGCAVTRGQESVGNYAEDTAITTSVKAQFVENRAVDASMIKVETMKGTVLLSGFAKNGTEKSTAEAIARNTKGVTSVRNEITVRP